MKNDDLITKPAIREIIDDFANEIINRKRLGAKPSKEVIYFRNEHKLNIERDVFEVPIDLLRFRKDNGRIASDVSSYEKDKGLLLERSEEAQKILRDFLDNKNPEKTNELTKSMYFPQFSGHTERLGYNITI